MSADPIRTFGELLKHYRQAKGLSQEGLAERAGLSVRGISDLEREARRAPWPSTLKQLADGLDLTDQERAAFLAAASGARRPVPDAALRMSRLQPSLLGRASELAALKEHVSKAEAAPLLLLAGQPGIGKTRLLAEMAIWASEQGFTVLRGGCRRGSEQSPFSPIVDALADHVRWLRDARLRPPLDGCGWLVRLLPELADLFPTPIWEVPSTQERRLMFGAAARFLSNVSGPAGAVLLLDDLQWAGTDAFDLLASLVSAPEGASLRVVGAYRDTDVSEEHPLQTLRADLAREGWVSQLSLSPLAPDDATTLVTSILLPKSAVDTDRAQRLAQWAGGVPFHLVTCAEGIRAGVWDGADPAEIPFAIAASISQRMGRLSPAAQKALRAGAVIGRDLPVWLVVAVATHADLDEEAVISALEEACRAQLLHEAGDDTYAFAHDLVHESIRAGIPTALRRKLHRRIAEALEDLAGRADERWVADLAWHLLEAGERGRALPYVLLAGDQAEAVYAHAEAEQHYRTAVEVAQEVGDERREAEALEKLAAVLRFMTRYDEALEFSERTATIHHNLGDVESEGRALWLVCWICWMQHLDTYRLDQVIMRAEEFLKGSHTRGLSPLAQARVHSILGRLLIKRSGTREDGTVAVAELRRALTLAEQGIDLAQSAGHGEMLARTRATQANAFLELGRLDEAVRAFEAVVSLAEAPGALVPAAMALASAEYLYLCRGDFKTSHEYIERALALVERTGDIVATAGVMVNRGRLAYYTGAWGQARSDFDRAATMLADTAVSSVTEQFSPTRLELGLLCLAEGQWEASTAYIVEQLEHAERWRDLQMLRVASGMLAERDLLEGDPQAAHERLASLLDRPGMQEFQVQYVLSALAWACLELGEESRAQMLAAKSMARAVANGQRLFLVDALRVQALISMRMGKWRNAEANIKRSLAISQDMGYLYAAAKSLYVYGQLNVARGESAPAQEKYQAALAICERLGEWLYRPHIERTLAGLDLR